MSLLKKHRKLLMVILNYLTPSIIFLQPWGIMSEKWARKTIKFSLQDFVALRKGLESFMEGTGNHFQKIINDAYDREEKYTEFFQKVVGLLTETCPRNIEYSHLMKNSVRRISYVTCVIH